MLFNVRGDIRASKGGDRGWLIGVDQSGAHQLRPQSDRPVQGVRRMPNGNLLVTIVDGLVLEMTLAGDIVRHGTRPDAIATARRRRTASAVEAETFHHGVNLGPDGNMLLLSMEIREYDNWPGSATDPNAPRERAKLVGDIVMEVRPDGRKLNEWRMLDLLDPYRITYGSRANYWVSAAIPTRWTGATPTAPPMTRATIPSWCRCARRTPSSRSTARAGACAGSSARTATGESRGPTSCSRPTASVAWQFHQHDCSITPAGTILCFDNGNHRALPFATLCRRSRTPAARSNSRSMRRTERCGRSGAMATAQTNVCSRASRAARCGLPRPATPSSPMVASARSTESPEGPDRFEPRAVLATLDIRARLIEVTPDKEVVLDLRIGGEPGDPKALSVFRSEHVPA